MDETIELNRLEDLYADGRECEICHLPKTVVAYELGFKILKQQLSELKIQLQQALRKLTLLNYK